MSWRETVNKPAAKPAVAPKPKFNTKDDDWDTDPSYKNDATEKSQRFGSASVPGSGRLDHVDLNTIQQKMKTVDQAVKEDFKEKHPTRGYGGKYGTEQVMDKAAEGFSYKADVTKHSSQTDGKKGFGGEHGIDERAKDQSAVGFDYKPTVEKHSSQTDASKGFGGKYGTDQNAQDQSAVGFSDKETAAKHSSQTDDTAGLGSKQDVQKEEPKTPPAKPAVTPPPPPAKPAVTPPPPPAKPAATPLPPPAKPAATPAPPPKPSAEPKMAEKPAPSTSVKADVGNIRAKFENMGKAKEAEAADRVAEERKKRAATDQKLQQQQQQQQQPKSNNKAQEEVKEQKIAPIKQEPSPARPTTPPQPEPSTENTSETVNNTDAETVDNINAGTEISTTNEEKQEEPDQVVVSGINESSSSLPKNDDIDGADNKDDTNT